MTNLDFSPFIVGLTSRIASLPLDVPAKERKMVLIVDDDAAARLLLRLALKTEPYQLLEAADSEVALGICSNTQPDLILLNIVLPRTDGITVLQQIRQINQQAIILIVSAMNMKSWVHEAFAHGADGFIAKPFNLLAMRQMVAHLLDRNISKHAPGDVDLFVPHGEQSLGAVCPSSRKV